MNGIQSGMGWRQAGVAICYVCAISWFATGILYLCAGIAAPVVFDPSATFVPERLAALFQSWQGGVPLYAAAFAVFAVADFALLLLASVLREFVGRGDFRAQLVYVCVSISMLIGLLVDLLLLSHWLVIGGFAVLVSPEAQAALWIAALQIQTLGVWMSVASFLIGGLGLVFLIKALWGRSGLANWTRMTIVFAVVIFLEVAAILWDMSTGGSGLLTAAVFLVLTNIVAPVWSLWLARTLRAEAGP